MNHDSFIFSADQYAGVLKLANSLEYQMLTFNQLDTTDASSNYLLIRHDIDVSLTYAREMARLENKHEVCSTYFFMLRSPAYNLFSRYAFETLKGIKELGHEIALHFDAAHPSAINNDLEAKVEEEKLILSNLIEDQITAVSFHQPSQEILKGNLVFDGLINTYNTSQMHEWYYLSDSNRVWKEHNAISVLEAQQYKKIQMLIHPMWWMCDDKSVESVWNAAVVTNFYAMQEQFLSTEGAYGAARKFKISS